MPRLLSTTDIIEMRERVHPDVHDNSCEVCVVFSTMSAMVLLLDMKADFDPDEPRDDNGKWTSGGSGGSSISYDDHPKQWAKDIAAQLNDGGHPNIEASQLDTLLTKASKSDSPAYVTADVTNLKINGTTLMGQDGLGFPRSEMPQVPTKMRDQYFEDMAAQGFTSTEETVDPTTLQPSQSEIGMARVAEIYNKADGEIDPEKQIVISQDNYIIDGHHHWAADVAISLMDSSQQMSVVRLAGPALEVIAASKAWATAHGGVSKSIGMRADFDPDEPRDDSGKWTGDGGGDSSGKGTGGIAPTPSSELANMTPDELSAHMADVIARQNDGIAKGLDTEATYDMVEGIKDVYSGSRIAQQQTLIDMFTNAPGVKSENDLLIMAGLAGSGKTTFLIGSPPRDGRAAREGHAQELNIDVESHVVANPDVTKSAMERLGMIPDYSGLGLTKEEIGTLVQEEASYITQMIVKQAAASGKNIIIDSTMKNNAQFLRYAAAVSEMKDQPYTKTMILTDSTKEQSIERAISRYQNGGRFVPISNIQNLEVTDDGKTASRVTFEANSPNVDRAILVNGDGNIVSDTQPTVPSPPTLIADGSPTLGSPADGAAFSATFEAAFKDNPYTAFVNHYTPEEIQNEGMKPLTSNNGQTGLLIHDHGDGRIEATALYNVSGVPGAGSALLQDSVANHGVNYVECFGDGLKGIYEKVGFQVDTTSPFDPQYAPENWNYEEFGTPNYYTMKTPT